MAIEQLQTKIRRCKNPVMLNLTNLYDGIPSAVLAETDSIGEAYDRYARLLLEALKKDVAAVRFNVLEYLLVTGHTIHSIAELTKYAQTQGLYVLLDFSGVADPEQCKLLAECVWGSDSEFTCDGILISAYGGSDAVKPFLQHCGKGKKDLFSQVRAPHKSAAEIQDLLAGHRMVHMAIADYVNRFVGDNYGKLGYSGIGIAAAGNAHDSLKMLRMKYPHMFLIVDGWEMSGVNAKNCSYAFDKMGYGAIISVGTGVTQAWKREDSDPIEAALAECSNIRKKLEHYITVL